MKKSPTYYLAIEMRFRAMAKGVKRKITVEELTEFSYSKRTLSDEELFTPEEITILQKDVFKTLSPGACRLILQIISELERNNALWYFDHKGNPRTKIVLAELRAKQILLRTEDPRIHFVNPDYIRRGRPNAVLAMTAAELSDVARVSVDNIRALSTRDTKFNPLDNSIASTKLLKS